MVLLSSAFLSFFFHCRQKPLNVGGMLIFSDAAWNSGEIIFTATQTQEPWRIWKEWWSWFSEKVEGSSTNVCWKEEEIFQTCKRRFSDDQRSAVFSIKLSVSAQLTWRLNQSDTKKSNRYHGKPNQNSSKGVESSRTTQWKWGFAGQQYLPNGN